MEIKHDVRINFTIDKKIYFILFWLEIKVYQST